MKLWLLIARARPVDDYRGHLVCAESEIEARRFANASPGSTGMIWLDPDLSNCRELTAGDTPYFVLHDFTSR